MLWGGEGKGTGGGGETKRDFKRFFEKGDDKFSDPLRAKYLYIYIYQGCEVYQFQS